MPSDEMGRLVWRFQGQNGSPANVVMHFRRPDLAPLTVGDLTEAASQPELFWLGTGYTTPWRDFCNSNCSFLDVTATAFGQVPQLQVVNAVNNGGGTTGKGLPPESALVISWYTSFIGKSFRGRSFMPCIDPDMLDTDGTVVGTTLALMQTAAEELLTEFNTNTTNNLELSVYSGLLDQMNAIQQCVVRDLMHHQSRRNQ